MTSLLIYLLFHKVFSWKDILLYSLRYSCYSINLVELIVKEQYE